MKHLMAFVLFGSFLFISLSSLAGEFKGCHQFCGNEGNKAWWAVLRSHGLDENSSRTEKAPYTREADEAKEERYWQCMNQTLAEGKRSDDDCNGVAPEDEVPIPAANPDRCESEYQNAVAQCDSAVSAAKASCDTSRNSALNQGSPAASSSSQSSGITDSCGNVVTVATEAKNAWTSFRDQCSGGMSSCQSQCGAIMTWANNNPSCFPLTSGGRTITKEYLSASIYSPRADQCLDLQAKVDNANSTIASYGRTSDSASECKAQTDGGESTQKSGSDTASLLGQVASVATSLLATSTPTATPQAVATFCTANPSYPGCGATAQASCSDPAYAASNKVCQCAANPNSCRVVETGSGTVNLASIDSASRLPNSQNASLDGDLPSTPGLEMGPRPQGGDAPGIDGRQGGAPVGSSSVGSGGGAPTRANVDPNESNAQGGSMGTFGGGGGSAGGRFGAVAAGGSRSYGPGGPGVGGPGQLGHPDLRKFLPGGSYYSPQGTMMGGRVGIDGITGPNSNIWQKVQNRYRVLKDSLYP